LKGMSLVQGKFFTPKELKKYGMQVILLPYIEMGTNEMRYKIIGLCNGRQLKISETSKPIQALSELNNYFLKFSEKLKNVSEVQIKKVEDNLFTLEELISEFENKLKLVEEIPNRELLEKLPMRSKETSKSLLHYCKILDIKGYSKLSKEEVISKIIETYLENIKG